ncbi:CoA transferase [Nocardioides panzhihuensis]|uniref:Crotonobetainyl-CoA:carnitine CoA-transferase CaiB-like acyl-CoA transferase n=1 Tax=Nocardioides panzhihuensis TaxID=860243 RepID=A0A7Z0DH68_9ACTN|nr:CoA transferase [Nocardioides panzhihuensis]NYI75520.1 crotonobetainyl-CoA:carnitine CoA-transferase CaiB-like acyl-CoA transferase [Nocardioides panzhihuensis]
MPAPEAPRDDARPATAEPTAAARAEALRDWAASGAMALTGSTDGPPTAAPGRAASFVRESLGRVAELAESRSGGRPTLPDVRLLGERAAIAGFTRNAPWSCGGAFRTMRTTDGWLGLSLARTDDLSLVPALVEGDVAGDPWLALTAWASLLPTEQAADRAQLLGLATASSLPGPTREPVLVTEGGSRRKPSDRPRILDLTSLWAGPLCAHLLAAGGAEMVKVESTRRPEGARRGPPRFFDLLHAGHRMVALDFGDPADVARLRELVRSADLVVEASRPRALRQLGIDAAEVVADGTSWLSITAHGRHAELIGFGDDVAVGAGLAVRVDDAVVPCGDALADPLAGVAAAVAAEEALASPTARLVDVSMHHVAASVADGEPAPHVVRREGAMWWVDCDAGSFPVAEPVARVSVDAAGVLGADNVEVLR